MWKLVSVCTLGALYGFDVTKSAESSEEVRLALENAFDESEYLAKLQDYLDWVLQFNKLQDIDIDNVDELRQRFLNWKATDEAIEKRQQAKEEESGWEFGHTRFSDWSKDEKKRLVMDETFIVDDSRSATEASNCEQVFLTDSSLSSKTTSYSIDNREYDIGGIQDQGLCSSCWDFCDMATLEVNRNLDLGLKTSDDDASDSFVKLSEQYVLDCVSDDIGSCDGGYPILTLMYVSQNGGVCSNDDYNSYADEESTCESTMCDATEASDFSQLYCLSAENDEQVSLAASTFSLVFAFKVYEDFYNYQSGIYTCDTSEEFIGWHAVSMVGVTEDYFIVKNSWSTDWGDDGYFYMSKDAFGDCMMSHFAFVSFNDISDSISESTMDVGRVKELRTQSQAAKTILREENVSEIITKHIKIHGETNQIVLYVLAIIVGVSVLCMICGQLVKSINNCIKNHRRKRVEAHFNEHSALLDDDNPYIVI